MVEEKRQSLISIEDLPQDDILYKIIFPLLSVQDWMHLLHTSKKLRSLTQCFFVVNRRIEIKSKSDLSSLNPIKFHLMTKDATNLRVLCLRNCTWMSDDILKPVLKNNHKLEEFDISNCNTYCTTSVLQLMTVNCPNITKLILMGCSWVDSESLEYVSNHRNSRKPNNIENVLLTMGKGLRTNLKTRTKAKYRGKEKLFDVMKKKEVQTSKSNLGLVRVKNLVELDLNGCSQVRDVNIETLSEVFKHVEILRIGYISSITDTSMKAIATHLKQLQVLDISHCKQVTDAGLFTVAKHCLLLNTLVIGEVQFKGEILKFLASRNIRIVNDNSVSNISSFPGRVNHRSLDVERQFQTSAEEKFFDGVMLGMIY